MIERPIGAIGVETICAMTDPVVRNLWITTAYYDLGRGMVDMFGSDATWCGFAVWASKTAGRTIRNEELPRRVRRLVDEGHADELAGKVDNQLSRPAVGQQVGCFHRHHVAQILEHIAADVAGQVAEGNAMVFAELAPVYAAFIDAFRGSDTPGPDDFDRSLGATLSRPGVDPVVREAFGHYWAAHFTADPARRANLVLAANIIAVAHEQQRLQPAIVGALEAPVDDALALVFHQEMGAPPHHLLGEILGAVTSEVSVLWKRVATEEMMRLATADEVLDLHHDVPPVAGQDLWPQLLAELHEEADTALGRWDRTGGSGRGSGAQDWSRLEDRMNYIVNLFRARQQHPPLLSSPFDPQQLSELDAGRRPPDPL